MKRRNKGKNKVLYVLIALAAVIAAGFIGVRFGLSQGSIRRARMADEASKPESASSGMISAESGKDDGNSDGTSSGEAGTSSDEAVSEAESAETDPEEAQFRQIRYLLKKRGFDPDAPDFKEKQKTMAFLHRKGYDADLIRRAVECRDDP